MLGTWVICTGGVSTSAQLFQSLIFSFLKDEFLTLIFCL